MTNYQLNGRDTEFSMAAYKLIGDVIETRNNIAHFNSKLFDPEDVINMKNGLVQLLHCFGLEIHHVHSSLNLSPYNLTLSTSSKLDFLVFSYYFFTSFPLLYFLSVPLDMFMKDAEHVFSSPNLLTSWIRYSLPRGHGLSHGYLWDHLPN